MTTLVVKRTYDGETQAIVIPATEATDQEYGEFLAELIREYLFRRGVASTNLSNAQILSQLYNTYRPKENSLNRLQSAAKSV